MDQRDGLLASVLAWCNCCIFNGRAVGVLFVSFVSALLKLICDQTVDLTPFGAAVASTLSLYQDKVDVASKAGVYRVAKYVYRAVVPLQAGQILGNVAGVNGSGPGGIEALVSCSACLLRY